MGVSDFQRDLQISQPLASHHLAALAGAGILQRSKAGRRTVYSITDGAIKQLAEVFSVEQPSFEGKAPAPRT